MISRQESDNLPIIFDILFIEEIINHILSYVHHRDIARFRAASKSNWLWVSRTFHGNKIVEQVHRINQLEAKIQHNETMQFLLTRLFAPQRNKIQYPLTSFLRMFLSSFPQKGVYRALMMAGGVIAARWLGTFKTVGIGIFGLIFSGTRYYLELQLTTDTNVPGQYSEAKILNSNEKIHKMLNTRNQLFSKYDCIMAGILPRIRSSVLVTDDLLHVEKRQLLKNILEIPDITERKALLLECLDESTPVGQRFKVDDGDNETLLCLTEQLNQHQDLTETSLSSSYRF